MMYLCRFLGLRAHGDAEAQRSATDDDEPYWCKIIQ